jgi:hypothetical protein
LSPKLSHLTRLRPAEFVGCSIGAGAPLGIAEDCGALDDAVSNVLILHAGAPDWRGMAEGEG